MYVLFWLLKTSKAGSLDKSGSHLDRVQVSKIPLLLMCLSKIASMVGLLWILPSTLISPPSPLEQKVIHTLYSLHIAGSRDIPAAPKKFGFSLIGLALMCSKQRQQKQHSLGSFSVSPLLFCFRILINSVPSHSADWRTLCSLVLVPWGKTPPGLILELGSCITGSQGRCKWHL